MGYYSYSIYLWHVLAMFGLGHMGWHWFRFPVYVIFAVLFGVLMSKLIECPSLRLRDKIFPSRVGDPALGKRDAWTSVEAQQGLISV